MASRPLAWLAALLALASAALAQPAPPAPPSMPAAEDLRALAEIMDRPAMRAFVRGAGAADGVGQPHAAPEAASQMMASRLDAVRAHLRALAAALPGLPDEFAAMRGRLGAEFSERGPLAVILPLAAFAVLGFLVQTLYWRLSAGLRRQMIALPVDTVDERLRAIGWRALYGIGVVAAFAAGSIGAFLAFDWPPLLQEIVLAYLLVFLAVRLTMVCGRIVLAPGAERFRMVPVATRTAAYWFRWSTVLVGFYAFGNGTLTIVRTLATRPTTFTLVAAALSTALFALALTAVWRRPTREGDGRMRRSHDVVGWLATVYALGLWVCVVTGAVAAFYVGLIVFLAALANAGLRLVVDHLLHAGSGEAAGDPGRRPVAVVAFDRGLRIALLVGAAALIARVLGLDLVAFTANDTPGRRLMRGALNVLIIALVADFAWQMARAWIDHRMSDAGLAQGGTDAEIRHRQRVRTLLPILRNLLLVALAAVAGLMALSTLGVEIGPLVAGAGVVGIAVGFGAQTLVKDVISGMFFLLDDAFRVGEYIESGRIKGTVESFSLRSIKLRHHRGPLHTVPFGSLSTITNYSRDWVIDKMTLGLDYGTDLDAVKRIVKDIGRELGDDPEFAPHILETLKMQGVDAFGDFALQVRLKMMTRPGEQFVIRRRAYALIKQRFDAQGIRFAYPTVTVAGGQAEAAAAQAGLAAVATPAGAAAG